MATLAELRTIISQKIKNPYLEGDITASVVNAEINRVIRYYQQKKFYFNTKTVEITLIANEQAVPSLPSDLLSPIFVNSLLLIDSDVQIPLTKLLPDAFAKMDRNQTGRPFWYTYRRDSFLLLPVPASAYTLEFSYLRDYPALVNDGDSNDFSIYAENLLIMSVIKHLYAENKDDLEKASGYQELEDKELRELQSVSRDYEASGELTIYSIL